MLFARMITAVILIPLVLAAILWMPSLYFSCIVGVLILVGAWEWSQFIGVNKNFFKIGYVFCTAAGILFFNYVHTHIVLLTAMLIWVWFFIAIVNYERNGPGAGFQWPVVRFFAGFVVLIATWMGIVTLKTDPELGPNWLIVVMLIIWAADVGGYFAGRVFGKHALCSLVSPKKTWEGFVGGMVLATTVAAISGLFLSLSFSQYAAFLGLALMTALFSVVGDLGVSLLKRMIGLKDSGKFFPGHGGVLDRLDSIAAATVVFVLGALFLM